MGIYLRDLLCQATGIYILLNSLAKTVSCQSDFSQNPRVHITLPPNSDKEFQNETHTVMTNANMVFDLHCSASYPIEWLAFFEEDDDGNSSKEKLAETRRNVGSFLETRTYNYSAILQSRYSGKLHVFTNFSCQAISNWRRQTTVIMTSANRKQVVTLEITNTVVIPPNLLSDRVRPNSQPACPVIAVASYLTHAQSCWKCETNQKKELELDFYGCETPIECNTLYQRANRGVECLKILNDTDHQEFSEADSCKRSETDYNPKFIACKQQGVALVQFYIFSVVRRKNGSPFIYFTWDQIEPQKMIEFHSVEKEQFSGNELTVLCELSKYYFSYGIWFAIERSGRQMEYIRAVEPPGRFDYSSTDEEDSDLDLPASDSLPDALESCDPEDPFASVNGSFTRKLSILVESDLRAVYCFGPVWNSEKWVNTSLHLSVLEGEPPFIVEAGTTVSEVSLTLGSENAVLRCEAHGKPFPSITWQSPKNSIFQIQENKNEHWSKLVFREVSKNSAGKYTCIAKSFKGTASKIFTVSVKDSYKSILVTLLAILIPIGLVIVVVIMFGWKYIQHQRKALRILTEAEVRTFVEGKPDFRLEAGSYFNEGFSIDSLPYDKSAYEIPLEKIVIDRKRILGSGAFGEVYRGSLLRSAVDAKKITPYGSFELAGGSSSKADITVAIKTVKADVDVEYFKALLSEIKIMAYLGVHRNVVCLLGANTENIRNRQAYIVVEFCERGSLESFLKLNSSSFVNRVRYGNLVEAEDGHCHGRQEPSGSYINVSDQMFSTYDLFKWASHVAYGMEYLQKKKVIHGDLAVRNILLSADLSAKIGDFGLSRQLIHSTNYFKKTSCPLPWKSLAPEALLELKFSIHSDIWAYGVTLWEIFSLAEVPYKGYTYDLNFVSEIEKGYRLDKPLFATNNVYEYMLKCWNFKPDLRPNFDEIQEICGRALQTVLEEGYVEIPPSEAKHKRTSRISKPV